MINLPLVTVYITNYNYERYIEFSIKSVLNQDLQDFELLIIDDGSTDKSAEIIERYRGDDRITIIYQNNKGLNVTNNVAMRVAKGKYLVRLDADDFLEQDALRSMVNVLETDDELGLVFPDYFYVDDEGVRTGEERRHNFKSEVSLYDQPAHGACTLIRLQYLKDLGGYNESFTCQDGYDLWIKFITHYKVTNINKPLFSYRRHGNNLTNNEGRILSTRQKIKEHYVSQYFEVSDTLLIIPVRNSYINGFNWPLYEINGVTILENKISICLKARKIKQIVITTSDDDIIEYCLNKYFNNEKISIVRRPKFFESPNQSLSETIINSIEAVEKSRKWVQSVLTISLEYPYLSADTIDDAVNTQVLFKADSVITVRPDSKIYYKHTGSGMVPILDQDRFTRLERDALYKAVGGLMLISRTEFEKSKKSVSGKVSHVIVNDLESFGVFTPFDFSIFNLIQKNQ